MRTETIKYSDGAVYTRLINSCGMIVAEVRGKIPLKQMIKKYGGC